MVIKTPKDIIGKKFQVGDEILFDDHKHAFRLVGLYNNGIISQYGLMGEDFTLGATFDNPEDLLMAYYCTIE